MGHFQTNCNSFLCKVGFIASTCLLGYNLNKSNDSNKIPRRYLVATIIIRRTFSFYIRCNQALLLPCYALVSLPMLLINLFGLCLLLVSLSYFFLCFPCLFLLLLFPCDFGSFVSFPSVLIIVTCNELVDSVMEMWVYNVEPSMIPSLFYTGVNNFGTSRQIPSTIDTRMSASSWTRVSVLQIPHAILMISTVKCFPTLCQPRGTSMYLT